MGRKNVNTAWTGRPGMIGRETLTPLKGLTEPGGLPQRLAPWAMICRPAGSEPSPHGMKRSIALRARNQALNGMKRSIGPAGSEPSVSME